MDVGEEQLYMGLALPFGETGDEIENLGKVFDLEKNGISNFIPEG